MEHTSCPSGLVDAPAEVVWALLTRPESWGNFFDLRITRVDPAGPAAEGQVVSAESGPPFLHLKLRFKFFQVDAAEGALGLDIQFPLGVTVREELICIPLNDTQCQVRYNCAFGFPAGWRGALLHLVLRRALDTGPADSLARLQGEAERLYGLPSGLPFGPA